MYSIKNRVISTILMILVLASSIFCCDFSASAVTVSVSVSPTSATLYVGSTRQLKATKKNTSATPKWTSSNTKVATVSSKGLVTAKSKGTATITVKVSNKTAKCKITVKNVIVKLNSSSKTIYVGSSATVKATVTGSNKKATWKIQNSKVATIKASGNSVTITAKNKGTTYLTATVEKTTVKCKITVNNVVITLNTTKIEMYNDESNIITATVKGSNKSVSWISSNSSVATLKATGNTVNVIAKKSGKAKISAKLENTTVTCNVYVYDYITQITLNTTEHQMYPDEKFRMTATVYPPTARYKDVNWSVSDTSIATIDTLGNVTGYKAGIVTITASAKDPHGVSIDCKFTLLQKVDSITFSKSSYDLYKCSKLKVEPNISPANAYNKSVSYSSNDTSIASIDSNGLIKPYKVGMVTITVTALDKKGAVGTYNVYVRQNITAVHFKYKSITVGTGLKKRNIVQIKPTDAYNKKLKYTIRNKNIASVDSNGYVKGKKKGSTTLKAMANDGSKSQAICKVNVFISAKKLRVYGKNKIPINYKSSTYKLRVTPSNSYKGKIKWYSSNSKVATINSKGKIKIKKLGYTNIYVINKDGSNRKSNVIKLHIYKIYIKRIDVNVGTLNIGEKDSYAVKTRIYPSNATYKKLKWTTSNRRVATVNSKGKIYSHSKGTSYIYCKTTDGSKMVVRIRVNVKRYVSKVTLNYRIVYISKGKTLNLHATASPLSANDRRIKWYSTNSRIASVSSSGKITSRGKGVCYIYARARDGSNKYDKCKVKVWQPVSKVSLSKGSVTLYKTASIRINAHISPSNATYRSVSYYSSNSRVATVNSAGVIKGKSKGTCYIYAKSRDGSNKKSRCKVTVYRDDGKIVKQGSYAFCSGVGETSYTGSVIDLSSSVRNLIKNYIATEVGYSYDNTLYNLVAQSVHDAMVSDGVSGCSVSQVKSMLSRHYPTYRNKKDELTNAYNNIDGSKQRQINNAITKVFSHGGIAVKHRIRYVYNGRKDNKEQHSHRNILNYGNTGYLMRFYD